jgi:hypothetical protein
MAKMDIPQAEDHRIGFRGEIHDYILIIIITLFVWGFFIIKAL